MASPLSDCKNKNETPLLENLPVHVGIIMDGNGRWATQRSLPRSAGHDRGLDQAKEIVKAASDIGIKYLTLYIFSTENWKRTEQEVGFLMTLIHKNLRQQFDFYRDNGIKLRLVGDISGLPPQIQEDIRQAEKETENFKALTLCMAINYGGRNEIVRGVKKLLSQGISKEEITEEAIAHSFDIAELPYMDLLIRTGGEKRLSNFMLWHSAYAELIFSDILWPDYGRNDFYKNLEEFQHRNRRFGAAPK